MDIEIELFAAAFAYTMLDMMVGVGLGVWVLRQIQIRNTATRCTRRRTEL